MAVDAAESRPVPNDDGEGVHSRVQGHVVPEHLGRLHRHVVVERQLALEPLDGEEDLGDLGAEVLVDLSEDCARIENRRLGD